MPSCVVKSCKNYTGKLMKSPGITYHTFPRNSYRKDEWVQIIRNCRGETDWNPSSASTVCSAHFDDADFKTTAKGLRCLTSFAIPKRLLSTSAEIQPQSMCIPILQAPELSEKCALTGYCRLCAGSDCSELIDVQSDNVLKNLVVNMTNRLNTNIDFSQEHLPTTICSVCVKMLYTAYDFVVGIDLAQKTLNNKSTRNIKCETPENANLSNNLDFSQHTSPNEKPASNIEIAESDLEKSLSFVPSVTTPVTPVSSNIDVAAKDFEEMWLHVPSKSIPLAQESPDIDATSNQNDGTAYQPSLLESSSSIPVLLDPPRIRLLMDNLRRQRLINDDQRKKIKIVNQKVRRLNKRNELLKNLVKKIKEKNYWKKPP